MTFSAMVTTLVTVDLFFVHVLHDRPESLVGFGVRKLKLALLVERHHRNPLVRGGEDCRGVLLYSRACEAGRAASAKGAGAGQVMAAGAPATQSKGAVGAVPVSENKTTELAISKSASTDATSALGIMTFILVARAGAFDANCDCASFSARASTCSASCTKPTLRNLVAASRSRATVVNISGSMFYLPLDGAASISLFAMRPCDLNVVMIKRSVQAHAARQLS
jgi:hypothetical protein